MKDEEDTSQVIIKQKPYEPVYVVTDDGEKSIPRKIFYDIVHAYRPYWSEVASTFTRLTMIFAVIIILFVLINMFQIFEELTDVGDTFLTIGKGITTNDQGVGFGEIKNKIFQDIVEKPF